MQDLGRIESAMLAAIDEDDLEQAAVLAARRDQVLREALPRMNADRMAEMAEVDSRLRAAVEGHRKRVADELDTLRKGRSAVSAYHTVNAQT